MGPFMCGYADVLYGIKANVGVGREHPDSTALWQVRAREGGAR